MTEHIGIHIALIPMYLINTRVISYYSNLQDIFIKNYKRISITSVNQNRGEPKASPSLTA